MNDAEKDLRNVLVFALADGQLGRDEQAFVNDLARDAGLDEQNLAALTDEVRAGAKTLSLSRDPAEARRVVELLAQAAAADRTVSAREKKLLRRVAGHIGVADELVDEVIDRVLSAGAVDDAEIEAHLEDVYAGFSAWDAPTRQAKLAELGRYGHQAVLPLLRLLESYRVPDGAAHALDLKALVAGKLGELGDERAAYYLIQQVNIGEQDDEITNPALRRAVAGALGKITGKGFAASDEGVAAARTWWEAGGTDRDRYDKLAL